MDAAERLQHGQGTEKNLTAAKNGTAGNPGRALDSREPTWKRQFEYEPFAEFNDDESTLRRRR